MTFQNLERVGETFLWVERWKKEFKLSIFIFPILKIMKGYFILNTLIHQIKTEKTSLDSFILFSLIRTNTNYIVMFYKQKIRGFVNMYVSVLLKLLIHKVFSATQGLLGWGTCTRMNVNQSTASFIKKVSGGIKWLTSDLADSPSGVRSLSHCRPLKTSLQNSNVLHNSGLLEHLIDCSYKCQFIFYEELTLG